MRCATRPSPASPTASPTVTRPGSTTRSESFVRRRWTEARGYVGAVLELTRRRREGRLDCVYLAALPETLAPGRVAAAALAASAVACPSSSSSTSSPANCMASRAAVSGTSPTSMGPPAPWPSPRGWRTGRSARRSGSDGRCVCVEVPIVVDTTWSRPASVRRERPTFVYSASDEYGASMDLHPARHAQRLWRRHPECELVVTGMRPETVSPPAGPGGTADTSATGSRRQAT